MKNLKIRAKLLTGFIILAVLTAAVGLTGVFGLRSLEASEHEANRIMTNANYISKTLSNIYEQSIWFREGVLLINEPAGRQQAVSTMQRLDQEYDALSSFLNENVVAEKGIVMLASVNDIYYNEYVPLRTKLIGMVEAGDNRDTYTVLDQLREATDKMTLQLDELAQDSMNQAESTSLQGGVAMQRMIILLAVISTIAVVIAVLLGVYIAQQISRPVNRMVQASDQLAKGDVDVEITIDGKDEISELARGMRHTTEEIRAQAQVLQSIADGDYRVKISERSERDVMNRAINGLIEGTSQILEQLRMSAFNVSQGASEIATASQDLASGAVEQAASVEQFSAALSVLSDKTKENEENAGQAMILVEEAAAALNEGVASMNDVLTAMEALEESSRSITRVIKVIDEIAFQTNILSLNAAVEAARAGQHGKGFAVVADEVRNLAGKSAEAAKETANLIESSIRSVQEGLSFVQHSNESINRVTGKAELVGAKVNEVKEASVEQARSIHEISMGVEQISMVVQANSAMAQQTAASSEEMSAQARLLDEIVRRFRLRENADTGANSTAVPFVEAVEPVSSGFALSSEDKYGVS